MKLASAEFALDEEQEFDRLGYLIVPDALSPGHVARLTAALDRMTKSEPEKIHNTAAILAMSDEFLDLIDLATILPRVQRLLGDNIWVNHTHFNVNPPPSAGGGAGGDIDFGWHRDGGAMNTDIPPPAPLMSLKVGFYLSDLSEGDRGQTYLIHGSHKTGESLPENHELPDTASPLCVCPGTAVIIDRRMIHSIRSANTSDMTRRAIFIQYAFRWLCPVDAMNVESLLGRCNATRMQLLGLSNHNYTIDGAEGRSGRYYPADHDIPIGSDAISRVSRRVTSFPQRIIRKLWG